MASCAHHRSIKPKKAPEYNGVAVETQPLVDRYLQLADYRGIHFTHTVTLGFKKINSGKVIGVCHVNKAFREIDIDAEFWKNADSTEKEALLFHELTHCYCGRDHDFSEGKKYPQESLLSVLRHIYVLSSFVKEEGFMPDGCPLSIMHPTIVNDWCMMMHGDHYLEEMFDRCSPY